MRVTFERLADHEWGSVLIARDDGVAYRMGAGPITAAIPHDLVHYTVEDALRMADGIWGAIAAGVVFKSMKHISGRRPPHAVDRSAMLIAEHRERLLRAELIGGYVDRLAHAGGGRSSFTEAFAALPHADAPSWDALLGAAAALRSAEERWRALGVGESLVFEWPGHRCLPRPAARSGRRPATTARRHR